MRAPDRFRSHLRGIAFASAWACLSALRAEAGQLRRYFIAADVVAWNYAPQGNLLADMECCSDAATWLSRGPQELPPVFDKGVFREYTDASFTRLKPRPKAWEHLGLLGPLIRAEVGDQIDVTLKNNLGFPVSLHPHGLQYDKANEGAGYPDGTMGMEKADDRVLPGAIHLYHWNVPERSGPARADPSSVVWLYHSHVDSPRDTNTGLVGAIIVTRKGWARPDGSPRDVDREFVTLFDIFDENQSRLAGKNSAVLVDASTPAAGGDVDDAAGQNDANRFHSINGFIFGNLPMPTMNCGERVRWYLAALGGESDLHTPHWHGNTVLMSGHRTDVVELLPASMKVADMTPDEPGIWMYHCHVNDHIRAGMAARYRVNAVPAPDDATRIPSEDPAIPNLHGMGWIQGENGIFRSGSPTQRLAEAALAAYAKSHREKPASAEAVLGPADWTAARERLDHLRALGFRTVVCLQRQDPPRPAHVSAEQLAVALERRAAAESGVRFVAFPIANEGPGSLEAMSDSQSGAWAQRVCDALLAAGREGPVAFHCAEGRDRTGFVAAYLRLKYDGWTAAQTIAELRRYGHAWARFSHDGVSSWHEEHLRALARDFVARPGPRDSLPSEDPVVPAFYSLGLLAGERDIYRCGTPTLELARHLSGPVPGPADEARARQILAHLRDLGVRTIVSLQRQDPPARLQPTAEQLALQLERNAAQAEGIRFVAYPMSNEGKNSLENLPDAAIRAWLDQVSAEVIGAGARGGVVFHCSAGHDRTGLVAAYLRVRSQDWPVEAAIAEMVRDGHHIALFTHNGGVSSWHEDDLRRIAAEGRSAQ